MRAVQITSHLLLAVATAALTQACAVDADPRDPAPPAETAPAARPTAKVPFAGARPTVRASLAPDQQMPSIAAAGDTFGPFQFVADHSGKCLDVTGGPIASGDGVRVQQWGCFASRPTNQQWFLVDTGDVDSWYIVAANSGRCLDVDHAGFGDGVPVQQWQCLGYDHGNQRWIFDSDGNLLAAHSGRCLDVEGGPGAVEDGRPTQQWACFEPTTANQRWTLR